MRVYILLYNAGTANEGIHTLQTADTNIILVFESEDDAIRYGLLLEAQDFLSPSIEAIDLEEIEEFCKESGYDYKIVEAGMLAIPPEKNVDDTDWNQEGNYPSPSDLKESTESSSQMSETELDRIRRQLEGLL
jgi:hypothetical protein